MEASNPFSVPEEYKERVQPTANLQAESPWGISSQDEETIDSIADPSRDTESTVRLQQSNSVASAAPTINPPELTHVTSTGEAHMVDVGAKTATKRVAIAFACVRFSNPEPFRLIFENNNKKGDVLGVARVAGIMAAKRTSDLIPLCHPLAISKAEVEVNLAAPNTVSGLYATNKHGLVSIQALVECTGPTGVEMEALTAATGAALTVYDMCKAVDKLMTISSASVVYKSGGRSGTFTKPAWISHVGGPAFFESRGIPYEQIDRDG